MSGPFPPTYHLWGKYDLQSVAFDAAECYDVDPNVFAAVIGFYSSWNPLHMASVIPPNRPGCFDPPNPIVAIHFAAKLLSDLLDLRAQHYASALADYKVGHGASKDDWYGAMGSFSYPMLDAAKQPHTLQRTS